MNLLKVNLFTGIFYRFSPQDEETVTGEQLQNRLFLMIYIKRSVLTRRMFRETVFKATIFCSVTLIVSLLLYGHKFEFFLYSKNAKLKIFCSY